MTAKDTQKNIIYISKTKLFIILFLVLAAVTCGVFVLVNYLVRGVAANTSPILTADPNARVGSLALSAEEQLAAMQKIVDEGMANFSINATPYFENADAFGNIGLENLKGSLNRFTVEIKMDETGDTIYKSGLILPGQYIELCKLTTRLSPGEYPCTAYLTTYALNEDRYIGQVGAKITVYVDNKN